MLALPDKPVRRRLYLRKSKAPLSTVMVALRLTAQEKSRLELEAAARGMRLCGLVRRLIETVVEDGMIRAVLDDA